MRWLSLYIFYSDNLDSLLVECIDPLMLKMKKSGFIEGFFFVRFAEGGPHLRLRILAHENAVKAIEDDCSRYIYSYLQSPSSKANIRPSHWFPDNSIRSVPYEPEEARYGGYYGIKIAEEHFIASSVIILSVLRRYYPDLSYAGKVGVIIKLHYILAFSIFNENKATLRAFFLWLSQQFISNQKFDHLQHYFAQRDTLFESQREELLKYIRTIHTILSNCHQFENSEINEWRNHASTLRRQLLQADEQGLLQFEKVKCADNRERYWRLIADFLHMSSNRVGVGVSDENLIGYFIYKTIECL